MKPDYAALEKLADFLQKKVPDRAFSMMRWSRVISDKMLGKEHTAANYECGMAACLGGYAALLFPRRLRLVLENENSVNLVRVYRGELKRNSTGPTAFADAFIIPWDDASELTFALAMHRTPETAAHAIRTLIKRLKKERGDK